MPVMPAAVAKNKEVSGIANK